MAEVEENEQIQEEEKSVGKRLAEDQYFLITAAYDSTISFWEFSRKDFPSNTSVLKTISRLMEQPDTGLAREEQYFIVTGVQAWVGFDAVKTAKISHEAIGSIHLS